MTVCRGIPDAQLVEILQKNVAQGEKEVENRIPAASQGLTLWRTATDPATGQKVIVGLCLRLALHRLFAQSFPMWLVDEGTTHLDADNRRLYFQLIEQLKRDNVIKQIIIIDHDGSLSRVVDNIINVPITCTN